MKFIFTQSVHTYILNSFNLILNSFNHILNSFNHILNSFNHILNSFNLILNSFNLVLNSFNHNIKWVALGSCARFVRHSAPAGLEQPCDTPTNTSHYHVRA
jgi:hypothetical protein